MSGCQTCNTCQGCNSCQSCNSNCNDTGCNTIQAFCSTNVGQRVGTFSFGQSVSGDQTFLTKTNWNKIITYINNAYAAGGGEKGVDGGDSGLPESDSNTFMTAAMFNLVSEALCNLGKYEENTVDSVDGPSLRVKGMQVNNKGQITYEGDVIYGSYFEDLEKYANFLRYKTTQCDNCNSGCNVTCNDCQSCNAGGCQTNSPEGCCSLCNTCECSAQGGQNTTPPTS